MDGKLHSQIYSIWLKIFEMEILVEIDSHEIEENNFYFLSVSQINTKLLNICTNYDSRKFTIPKTRTCTKSDFRVSKVVIRFLWIEKVFLSFKEPNILYLQYQIFYF